MGVGEAPSCVPRTSAPRSQRGGGREKHGRGRMLTEGMTFVLTFIFSALPVSGKQQLSERPGKSWISQ